LRLGYRTAALGGISGITGFIAPGTGAPGSASTAGRTGGVVNWRTLIRSTCNSAELMCVCVLSTVMAVLGPFGIGYTFTGG
jgi:hypothetical protein